jgi:hypothetical protein
MQFLVNDQSKRRKIYSMCLKNSSKVTKVNNHQLGENSPNLVTQPKTPFTRTVTYVRKHEEDCIKRFAEAIRGLQ